MTKSVRDQMKFDSEVTRELSVCCGDIVIVNRRSKKKTCARCLKNCEGVMAEKAEGKRMPKITLDLVKSLIAKVPKERRGAMVCSIVGHSRIVDGFFGEVYCGRCEAKIADQLLGSYNSATESVRIGHNCETCRANYKKMNWRDKFMAGNPFRKATLSDVKREGKGK